MLKDSIHSLKFDRRLASRRGWVPPGELADALRRLPDVKDKAAEPAAPQPPADDPKTT